ncbi:MAG: cytochrome c oxidase subunit 3, partial [Verrucomicrobiales bacterium]
DKTLTEMPAVAFKVDPPAKLEFFPRDVKEAKTQSRLRDETTIDGELLESPMVFHYVDALDFRFLAMKAKDKGLDPMAEIEKSWILNNSKELKEAWEWHKGEIAKLEAELKKDSREPTFTERYRIEWKDFVAKAEHKPRTDRDSVVLAKEQIFGPDYEERAKIEAFPSGVEVPREEVAFASKFAPAWNTYYAIYFTMTGLHGLHVVGGALVLAYYLFFGKKMYLTNPEWLANRVEIGGLFWHFVDLVWIFLFPLLYLM